LYEFVAINASGVDFDFFVVSFMMKLLPAPVDID
jgi:hypothetical protein